MKQVKIQQFNTDMYSNITFVWTDTASSVLLPMIKPFTCIDNQPITKFSSQKEWEQKLDGSDASGGDLIYINEYRKFELVREFSNRMLEESMDVPPKYDAVFMANIEDILA